MSVSWSRWPERMAGKAGEAKKKLSRFDNEKIMKGVKKDREGRINELTLGLTDASGLQFKMQYTFAHLSAIGQKSRHLHFERGDCKRRVGVDQLGQGDVQLDKALALHTAGQQTAGRVLAGESKRLRDGRRTIDGIHGQRQFGLYAFVGADDSF